MGRMQSPSRAAQRNKRKGHVMKPWISTFVRDLLGHNRKPRKNTYKRARLSIEALEDRAVPATFTVTTALDDNVAHAGFMSLRQAINSANNNGNPAIIDVIRFSASLNGQTIL